MAKVELRWGHAKYAVGAFKSPKIMTPDIMHDVGVWLAVRLVRRTQDGLDEDGRKFKRYTDAYARWKNVAPSSVDLTLSGDMLNDFNVLWSSRNRVRVGFRSSRMAERAQGNEDRGRRFLGIPTAWLREVKKQIAAGLDLTRV